MACVYEIIKSGGNKTKITLICLRIDNNELKTTEKNEWLKFIKRHRGKVKSIEHKLQKALEYSYDELYKFKLEEGKKKQE